MEWGEIVGYGIFVIVGLLIVASLTTATVKWYKRKRR